MDIPSELRVNTDAAAWKVSDNADTSQALQFHRSLPGFQATHLTSLDRVAERLGIASVYFKCETSRLGLSSFKILGASWGLFRAVCQRLQLPSNTRFAELVDKTKDADITVFTASQGNHGLAVSKMGQLLGIRVQVHLPADSSDSVESGLRNLDATVFRSRGDYDAAVRDAWNASETSKGIVVQDTAWPGYEEIPAWIVQGYSTILQEIDEQLGGRTPDLIVTPVGVGSLAEAVVRHCKSGTRAVRVLAVEPTAAACLHESLKRDAPVTVGTSATIMSGMNCGTVSSNAWPVLRRGVDCSIAVPDAAAHDQVDRLYLSGIEAGPCGAAALAGLLLAEQKNRAALGLTDASVVVVICTEGPRPYRYQGLQYPTAAHSQDGQAEQRIILT